MPSLFALTLFLSAALLFTVQPLIARMLLPRFGGAPAVWNTCLVFFQAALLAGYGYAHLLGRRLDVRRQTICHLAVLFAALLLAPLVLLPLGLARDWAPPAQSSPIPTLLGLLVVSIGIPFVVLSATAPLLQKWFAHSRESSGDPYFLYAASNLGSMIALLGYPLLLEPTCTLWRQGIGWSGGFALLFLLIVRCAGSARKQLTPTPTGEPESSVSDIAPGLRFRWLALAFVPSSLLYGVTTFLSTDVASVPLLWVVPLAVYLLTFTLVFARRPAIAHAKILRLFPVAVLLLPFILALQRPFELIFPLHLGLFFLAAMACHGELARLRPDAAHLTEFYLWLATGGVLGGLFNALFAPAMFTSLVEYPLAFVVACFLVPSDEAPASVKLDWNDMWIPILFFVVFTSAGPLAKGALRGEAGELRLPILVSFLYGFPATIIYFLRARPVRFGLLLGSFLLGINVVGALGDDRHSIELVDQERSFFGRIRVIDVSDADEPDVVFRQFIHGITLHGVQRKSDSPEIRRQPLSYYYESGPIGDLFASRQGRFQQVGVLGLGAGALAGHADAGQNWTFYEIDPAVSRVAEKYFDFLQDARGRGAKVEIVDGVDARLGLERNPQQFDLLFADAFSSDAVPVHLLTREALELYRARLAPGAVLVVNITNRYLDLEPVLASLAADAGMAGRIREEIDASSGTAGEALGALGIVTAEEKKLGKAPSRWVILAEHESDLGKLADSERWRPLRQRPGFRMWTDDYSNLFGVLRW